MAKGCLVINMETTSCDMHEELFVEIAYSQEPVPLDKEMVAEEWRYYKMSPAISSKYSAVAALTRLYDEACFYDRAITVCKLALRNSQLKEYRAELYFKMGEINEHKRDFDRALNSYLKSLRIGLGNGYMQYWLYKNITFCYLIKKDFSTAERHCRIAIDIGEANWIAERFREFDPNVSWEAWKNMGVVMEHAGKYLEAASFYTTAIKLSHRLSCPEISILHLRRLLKRHPDLVRAWKEPVEDLLTYYNVII